jgi:hypothetical protein
MMDFNEFQTIDDLNAKRRALAEDLRFVDSVITAYSQRLETSEKHLAASLERVASQTSGVGAGATEGSDKTQPQHRRGPSSPARLTIIDQDLPSLSRPRRQGAPVFATRENPITAFSRSRAADQMAEDVVKGLKADWRRWTRVERIAAVCIALAMSSMVPALLLLEQG